MSSTTETNAGAESLDDWELGEAVVLPEDPLQVLPPLAPKQVSKPEKVHKCDKCCREFKQENSLKQHTCLFGVQCTLQEHILRQIGGKHRQTLEILAALMRQECKTRGKEKEEARLAVYESCVKTGNPEMAADYCCAMMHQLLVCKTTVIPQKGIQGVAGKVSEWDSLPRLRMNDKQFAALYSFSRQRLLLPVPSNFSYVLGYPFGGEPPKKKEVIRGVDLDDLQFF